MNSGSYFVIFAGLLLYMMFNWFINKICTCNAKSSTARNIGIYVYQSSFWDQFTMSAFKLFLESYFDLTICTFINITAFIRAKNIKDFREFFETRDDIICSTISILYVFLVLYFPIFCYKYI